MTNIVKKKLAIDGMHCSSCAINIDMDLEDVPGVKSARTSYAKQECEVEFEQGNADIDLVIQTIEKTGYKAQLIADE